MKFNSLLILALMSLLFVSCGGAPQVQVRQISASENRDTIAKCVYNIYVENSGSMDGYVKGVTEFEQSVYSFLSDIKISEICAEMNLYYINTRKFKQPADVEDFIRRLEPDTFRAKGGNRTTTDLSNIIGDILDSHGRDTVSILISDFVFSPGSGVNADEYLLNQQIGIKNHFAYKLRQNPDLGVMIYHLSSRFEGKYYDRRNVAYNINQQRPFYMMIVGDSHHLNTLSDNIPKEKIRGSGVLNTYHLSKGVATVQYGFMVSPKIGRYDPDPSAPLTSIINTRIDRRNPDTKFMMSIGVDCSSILIDNEYLMNPTNYELSNKSFTIAVDKLNNNPKYTHLIKMSLNPQWNNLYKGPLSIQLLKRKCEWSESVTNTDDEGIDKITTDKTYGFKYLVDGLYDAFSADTTYMKLNVNIR